MTRRSRHCAWVCLMMCIAGLTSTAGKPVEDPQPSVARKGLEPPYTTPPRLAYVIMGSGFRDASLIRILEQIRERLMPWTPGDLVLLHTGEYHDNAKRDVVLSVIPTAVLLPVPKEEWNLPEDLHEGDAASWKGSHSIGYRHMCRWYSNGLFRLLDKLGYTWVIRLDDDSSVLDPVQYNVVDYMEQNNKKYGLRLWMSDGSKVTWSLPEATAWFLVAKEMQPSWLLESCQPSNITGLNSWGGWNRRVIYNNMFMANIKWWMSSEVQAYLKHLNKTNGFYLFRWGDAPVHTMVVKIFLRKEQVHMFDFGYCHKTHCVSNATRATVE